MDEIPPLVLQKSGSLLVERGGSQLGLSGPQSPCGVRIVVAQSLSQIRLFATPWTAARQPSLSFTISQSLLKLMFIESVMPSNYLILFCPLLLLPSIFPSSRVFSNESALCIRWPKYWSFSFSISPSNEYSGLLSFKRTGWISLLTRDSQESSRTHSSKASILRCSAFFIALLFMKNLTRGQRIYFK